MKTDFCLGDWTIKPQRDCIERGGKVVHIAPKSMAVLLCLAENQGQVVSRQELFDTVWPGAEVTDDALTQRISELRKAFGDSAQDSKVIETIPKIGFRLKPPVTALPDKAIRPLSLFSELKRRNVFRVAIAYLAASWLLTEVAGTLLPAFGIPEWAFRFIVILLILGFIPTLVFSWAYEITPEGLKREEEVVRETSITHLTAKRLDGITISLIALALVFVAADRSWFKQNLEQPFEAEPHVSFEAAQIEKPESPWSQGQITIRDDPRPSVAVLPFANQSGNNDDEGFVKGIHDDILTSIEKIGSIRTISRQSVEQFKDSTLPLPEIADILGAGHILEGGVQRAGEQVRINVQLIKAETDSHLWSDRYIEQVSIENMLAFQFKIAEAVAVALQVELTPAVIQRIRTAPTKIQEAKEAYQFGNHRLELRGAENLEAAIGYFRDAIRLDPGYAEAYAKLADTYLIQAPRIWVDPPPQLALAQEAIDTALSLNPELSEAYAALGNLRHHQKDWSEAKNAFNRAIELNPNNVTAYHWYAYSLHMQGRFAEAIPLLEKTVALDPISEVSRRYLASAYRMVGDLDKAFYHMDKELEIRPGMGGEAFTRASIYQGVINKQPLAARGYVNIIENAPELPDTYVLLAMVFLDLGDHTRADTVLTLMKRAAPSDRLTAWAEQLMAMYAGELEGGAEAASRFPVTKDYYSLLSQISVAQRRNLALSTGQNSAALAFYQEHYPELFSAASFTLDMHNYRAAIDLAFVLQRMDQHKRADLLLEKTLDFIKDRLRLDIIAGYWISDVQILALLDQRDQALTALRQAVAEGWRTMWWYYLLHDPNLESIRDEPVFQAIIDEIRTDMTAQLSEVVEMEKRGELAPVLSPVTKPGYH